MCQGWGAGCCRFAAQKIQNLGKITYKFGKWVFNMTLNKTFKTMDDRSKKLQAAVKFARKGPNELWNRPNLNVYKLVSKMHGAFLMYAVIRSRLGNHWYPISQDILLDQKRTITHARRVLEEARSTCRA